MSVVDRLVYAQLGAMAIAGVALSPAVPPPFHPVGSYFIPHVGVGSYFPGLAQLVAEATAKGNAAAFHQEIYRLQQEHPDRQLEINFEEPTLPSPIWDDVRSVLAGGHLKLTWDIPQVEIVTPVYSTSGTSTAVVWSTAATPGYICSVGIR